ncbi:cytochrome P450 [Streptomyces diacarni]|uniref:Cytochrome P450 n=1 Tax=Streptomyces diacarni TaxID=2800381 RepID=A0A367EAZ3_9ACTN|nr:cytochrome P450 [Streptomyces diacarni]RCG15238.1 cytochrome P450 [Streptomyces diacarni]
MTVEPDAVDGLPTARGCPFSPPAELTELSATRPLTRMSYPDGHMGWLVTSHPLARRILASQDFSARHDLRHSPIPTMLTPTQAPPGAFIGMDPPEHTRYRKPLNQYFTVRRIRQLEPAIERTTREHLHAMEETGAPTDLMRAFALPIPVAVISELLGSTPEINEELQRLRAVSMDPKSPAEDVGASVKATHELMQNLVTYKRHNPGDDLLTKLIDDGELDDAELTGLALMMLIAGHETTAQMIGLSMYYLLRHEEIRDRLTGGPVLTDEAVNELLRCLSAVQFVTRVALTDLELGGVTVRKGEACTISLPAVNRDARAFEEPDLFKTPNLFEAVGGTAGNLQPAGHSPASGNPSASGSHLAFGHGIHQCIGHNLARSEMKIAIGAVWQRFPALRLAGDDADITTREAFNTYGLDRLPVEW